MPKSIDFTKISRKKIKVNKPIRKNNESLKKKLNKIETILVGGSRNRKTKSKNFFVKCFSFLFKISIIELF